MVSARQNSRSHIYYILLILNKIKIVLNASTIWIKSSFPPLLGKKCANFVSLSTITQITVYPSNILGKFMAMFSHFFSNTLRGCNNLVILCLEASTYWHTRHLLTNFAMFFFILYHQKCCFKYWYILILSGCIENGELWASVSILFFSSSTIGTHSRPLHNSLPSNNLEKLSTRPGVNWLKILVKLGSSCWDSIIFCWSVGWTVSRAIWATTPSVTTAIPAFSKSACHDSLVMRVDECAIFQLRASASTLALLEWY